jgi:hypothetical protein
MHRKIKIYSSNYCVIIYNCKCTGEFTAYGGQSSAGYGGEGTVYESSGSKTKLFIDNKEVHSVQV